MMLSRRLFITILLLLAGLTTKAQLYSNDFENQYTWYPPWSNIVIVADSSSTIGHFACLCDSTREYGLGLEYRVHDSLRNNNLSFHFEADYRFPDTTGQGEIVFTILKGHETRYWESYYLTDYANDSAQWFHVNINLNIPNDYLDGSQIKTFLWNRNRSNVLIDNAKIAITPWTMPSYLPDIEIEKNEDLLTLNSQLTPLTYSIGLVEEYILDDDTITEYNHFTLKPDYSGFYWVLSGIDTTYLFSQNDGHHVRPAIKSIFHRDCKLLRKTLVIPFIDSTLTVYRRNMTADSLLFQSEYYLDHEGFQIGKGNRSVVSYHQTAVSSTQIDAEHRIVYFNLDYWRDHPMIHYPLSDTIENHFDDVSYRSVASGSQWINWIDLYIGEEIKNLPRIMPIPYGHESGIIFTEHADWTDIRTHRATYFGSEHITKAENAIGGYVYYGIPVTKSVFYNNPDHITNEEISHGTFTGLHATIKTDKAFAKFLKQLYKRGYEICLHTPEQYTTTPSNLAEAVRYMRKHFKSVSWIDHGYNNGPKHNREDLVCDGMTLSADLWKGNSIQYLWNAYYEENRMEQWHFDNNLIQPYPGFGDALPNRQVTTITGFDNSRFAGLAPTFEPEFLVWATPSTLDITNEADWDYYYSDERLQRLVDNHHVHITHVYSPWVWPGRTFWTYDADSTIVAMPAMNRALERIANLRDEHKMLPMTVKTYLEHYSGLLNVDYAVIDSNHILLSNFGPYEVKGFTLLCPSPIRFEDNRFYEFRKSGNEYYIWFDLKVNDRVIIEIKN